MGVTKVTWTTLRICWNRILDLSDPNLIVRNQCKSTQITDLWLLNFSNCKKKLRMSKITNWIWKNSYGNPNFKWTKWQLKVIVKKPKNSFSFKRKRYFIETIIF